MLGCAKGLFTFYIFVLASCGGASSTLEDFTVIDFVRDVWRMHGFQNVLIMQNRNGTLARQFVWENSFNVAADDNVEENPFRNEPNQSHESMLKLVERIMREIHVPVLQFNEFAGFYLKRILNDQILSIISIDGTLLEHTGLLKSLLGNLRHMTVSKVLFLINFEETELALLNALFRFCWAHKLLNVVALFTDYQHTAHFYSYTNFPSYSLETKEITASLMQRQAFYPYRLGDLNGYKLAYILGGSDPRIIVYLDENGKMVVKGFVGHFLEAFAYKYNCKLFEPLPAKIDAFAPSQELVAAVRNGTVDISVGITFPVIPFIGFSYPYEQMNWCVMMPVEPDVPDYEFYTIVFELSAFLITLGTVVVISMVLSSALYIHGYKADLLDVILHDDCLRGVLGQPFSEVIRAPRVVRFIYLQICVLGILLTTSYNAYFATYVTSAPKEKPLVDFDDILHSGIKVYAWTPEFNELVGRVTEFKRYVPMFYLENNYKQYLRMRDAFNTEYGYMMPTTKWKIVTEQQKIFTTPLFKRTERNCFFNNIPMCFPMHENSIFMQTIYQLILETAQAGLTDYWQKIGFLEMIIAGKLTFADLSMKRSFEPMQPEDLFYIWLGFGFMMIVVSLVFIGEQCIYHRQRIFIMFRKWRCCRWGQRK